MFMSSTQYKSLSDDDDDDDLAITFHSQKFKGGNIEVSVW